MHDIDKTVVKLRADLKYPATKPDLVAKYNTIRDFSPTEKAWFATHLPEGTYMTADEVIRALNINVPTQPLIEQDPFSL